MRSLKMFASFGAAMLLVGCAQLSPQAIVLSPELTTTSNLSSSLTASVTVEDRRASKVLGVRGGSYGKTSTITTTQPMAQVLTELTEQQLQQAGITLSSAFPDAEILVYIDKLSYQSDAKKAGIRQTSSTAQVGIEVVRGNSKFANRYSANRYIETLGYPSEEKNSELINGVVQSVLDRLFSDEDLRKFLSN